MSATALVGCLAAYPGTVHAQFIVNHDGGKGDDGASVIGDADADDGHPAGAPVVVTNNTPQNAAGVAFGGSANGGRGGDGGTALNFVVGIPPVEIQGGDGGDGRDGGVVDITNTSQLNTTGNSGHGISATASGGDGGNAGWGAALGYFDGGDGGNGGNGGNAKATTTATSVIKTLGANANGMNVIASGGDGGDGGTGGAIGGGKGGSGGTGGNGGTATGINGGSIETSGDFAKGMLVRAAGGSGGDGKDGGGLIVGNGGNGGNPTKGGTAEGSNSGDIVTHGNFASGMVVQSVGGGGGDGGGAFGLFGGGGAGANGNDGQAAKATNTGNITTNGIGSIGMLVESVGGGGGDGGGAAGLVSIGGKGAGGGIGGTVTANVGGKIVTGADGSGDGAHGVLAQSVGGGGGNGGFAAAVGVLVSVGVGGGGGTGGNGGVVNVNQAGAGAIVNTQGRSAIGILAQSVGGGGGNGGGAIAVSGGISVGVGGSGNAAGGGEEVKYDIANATVTTRGDDSIGILAQSVGGGGGNGGFAITGAFAVSVGVGGGGAAGGVGKKVDMTSGGSVETFGARSGGIVAQSIGGGGGNGGFTVAGSLGVTVGVGGSGSGGGEAGEVFFRTAAGTQQKIVTRGADSAGLVVQSVGGGGGNGGFAGTFATAANLGIGGSGDVGGKGKAVEATYNGSVETFEERSTGIVVQSLGGGGGNGGGVIGVGLGLTVGIGGKGDGGGDAGTATFKSTTGVNVTTHKSDSAGIVVQSLGGGGGNGGFSFNLSAGAAVGIGGKGGTASASDKVTVDISGGAIHTMGDRSTGIVAQSIGGGGGNGGGSVAGSFALNVSVGGSGGKGGEGKAVDVTNGASVRTQGIQSHGIFAQSVGGGGGSGGFSIAVGGPSLAIGGSGSAGGKSEKVTVKNTGTITTEKDMSIGIFAQSVGGSGGDGGLAGAGGLFAGVAIGGTAGTGSKGGVVEVTNNANITTSGALSHGILAQSVGGGGGNGGSAGAVAVGAFGAAGVAVAGKGGEGDDGDTVTVKHVGTIKVGGTGAKGILAQSVGGGGGNGGMAFSGAFSAGIYGSAAVGVSIGGGGGAGGNGGVVYVKADGDILATTDAVGSGGILAQSIGGSGGNGGRAISISGSVSTDASVNLGISVGGGGGKGGLAKQVKVDSGLDSGGKIVTSGYQAAGIMAQSIGGSGGNGGDSWSAAGGYGNSVTVSATVTVGGGAGTGNVSGDVHVTNKMTVETSGDLSSAIIAQSIGGGGGNGGSTNGATAQLGGGNGVNVSANVTIGGKGGGGNDANTVDVVNGGNLKTTGDLSSGIVAMSIGGSGGMGGSSNAKAYNLNGTSSTSVTVNIAASGGGGAGGDGKKVTVDNSGIIDTSGYGSNGITAMSIGGGGGAGGAATAGDEIVGKGKNGDTSVSIGFALAGGGGGAGAGGNVDVWNRSFITTNGEDSYGISAQSIGGGGGTGGAATAGASGTYAIGGAIAGPGGAPIECNFKNVGISFDECGGTGVGGTVRVFNLADTQIWTKKERSIGIFAQSVGGGGGNGGVGKTTGSDSGKVDVKLSMGGSGQVGGDGGTVIVENSGIIQTDAAYSHGIMAQSIGGSGGNGGASGSDTTDAKVSVALALGGAGGGGGKGGTVEVTNHDTGQILTKGDNSYGVFAQSIGGGGGSAGGGTTESDKAETAVSLAIGGIGGAGSSGGNVTVENFGTITTLGYLSHGIFAQSVGGGGGASGAAANASKADMTIGGALSLPSGDGADGGNVTVKNAGVIETWKDGSLGIFAQSVGGGGGYGGVVSADTAGSDSVALQLGGFGGNGGKGGDVLVDVSGAIVTHGERSHGVVAQSVGGGGGYGGDAKGKASNAIAIGGFGGKGGDGGDVTVIRTGTITTTGKDSVAIIAQSVGGGGGIGGAGFGRFGASEDGGSGLDNNTVGFTMPSGAKGSGGKVTIIQDGEIITTGDRGHGIVAQAVGGGGGIAGTLSLALNQSGAGSLGGIGDAAAAAATAKSQVWVQGASAYAMFGQSATGQGNSNAVNLVAQASLFAQGADSIAAYAESTSNLGFAKGNLTLDLKGQYTIGGGGTGVAAMLVGGQDNVMTNNSLTFAMGYGATFSMTQAKFNAFAASISALAADEPVVPVDAILESLLDDFSPLTIKGTSGNDLVNNERTATTLGRVIGNIDLGGGDNAFHNFQNASMVGLKFLDLGGGLFQNDGLMTNKGIGVLGLVDVTGGFKQSGTGLFVTDLDLNTHTTDALDLTGGGDFNGEAPLNFLSIDRLFGEYVLATGATMATTMTPTTTKPTVGFHFLTRVDGGTDLVLYADKPTFEDMINDPQSGVSDPGVVQMAQYFDGLETLPVLYDQPSELARMINMLRFLPDEEELGKALTRLTPHYAVHAFEMTNRSTDIMLQTARECMDAPATYNYDGRCVWFTVSPQAEYSRDIGANATRRDDVYKTLSMGALGEVNQNWSIGATIGRTEFESDITFKGEDLSKTTGQSWQAYALAKYEKDQYFADFAVGGGTGKFEGERDTTIAQVGYIPGETLGGDYLDELLLEGIGNSVRYKQNTGQFGASARFGLTQNLGGIYLQPTLQLDARWLRVSGKESGSVAAFNFAGTSNTYLSATPGLEIGTDIALSEKASLRAYVKGGIEFSNAEWKINGQFAAAEGLGAPPLTLTQSIDSPLYRVGAGLELNGVNGVGLALRYNGAFGESVNLNALSASLKVRF